MFFVEEIVMCREIHTCNISRIPYWTCVLPMT